MKFAIPVLLTVIVLLSLAVSAQAQKLRHSATIKEDPIENLLVRIQQRADGLIYISETDSEPFAFKAFQEVSSMTSENFLHSMLRASTVTVEEESFADFFEQPISNDPSGRWLELKNFLEANLTNTTVYRVGTIQVDVYVVGLFGNRPVGVYIVSVET